MTRSASARIVTAALLPGLLGLAACSSSGAATGRTTTSAAQLDVHIGLFGGPARPNGRSALMDSPVADVRVTAVDAAGHHWSARTDSLGTAAFTLVPGRYTVLPHYCGQAQHRVSVADGRTTRVQVSCPVP